MNRPREVPAWCRVRGGGSPLLLVAPHGGARDAIRPARGAVKVNDLHTAGLAEELATTLDASLIANPSLDRNQLDLNRISQVARAAPWFPALLETLLADILARHERAEVLFLHGWNTLQPKCDIGIGHPLAHPADAARHAPALTASVRYVTSRLAALRAACAARGIAAPLGERYPGRHANNLLQLFRRDGDSLLAPRIRAWVAADRVDAVQLELAAPLRWPGPLRGAFASALRDAFAAPAPVAAAPPPVPRRRAPPPPPPAALQVYDPASGLGLLARVDPQRGGGTSGRLLLFLDRGRVALFTGDDPHAGDRARGGPWFTPTAAGGSHLAFDGWALCATDGALYVDLERALAASRLLAVHADLTFTPRAGGEHGRVRGTVTLDGLPQRVDAIGFAPAGGVGQPTESGWRSHLVLRAALANGSALALRHRVPGGTLLETDRDGAAARATGALAITFDGEPYAPRRIVVGDAAGGLAADATARLSIVRPLSPGRRARVTLGLARVTRGGSEGVGFYEYARVVD
ncbi:hypothetical protein KF840_17400 [bacterium]|nr:hypothetical protein [bacterium]